MLAIREASPLELAGWDELVQRFDNHRIVHTRAWINWLEACGHGRPLYLILELDGQVVGCVPGLVVRLGFVRLFGSPLPGWQTPSMGPVFDRRRVTTQELATSLIAFLERRHGVQHIELMSNDFEAEAMAALGFGGEQVPTFRARLFPNDGARVLKGDRKSTRLNSSHVRISYAVFCLKKKQNTVPGRTAGRPRPVHRPVRSGWGVDNHQRKW